MSHETVYIAIYILERGELRADVVDALRTGRANRRKQGRVRPTTDPIRFGSIRFGR